MPGTTKGQAIQQNGDELEDNGDGAPHHHSSTHAEAREGGESERVLRCKCTRGDLTRLDMKTHCRGDSPAWQAKQCQLCASCFFQRAEKLFEGLSLPSSHPPSHSSHTHSFLPTPSLVLSIVGNRVTGVLAVDSSPTRPLVPGHPSNVFRPQGTHFYGAPRRRRREPLLALPILNAPGVNWCPFLTRLIPTSLDVGFGFSSSEPEPRVHYPCCPRAAFDRVPGRQALGTPRAGAL